MMSYAPSWSWRRRLQQRAACNSALVEFSQSLEQGQLYG